MRIAVPYELGLAEMPCSSRTLCEMLLPKLQSAELSMAKMQAT